MSGLKLFGRTPKPRSFEYNPRYWDQTKEEREEKFRVRNDKSVAGMQSRILTGIRTGYKTSSGYRKKSRNQNILRMVLILVIALLTVLILGGGGLKFVRLFQ
jgi:hypothetical protein